MSHKTPADKGVSGVDLINVVSNNFGIYKLKPNESLDYAIIYSGRKVGEEAFHTSVEYEINKRKKLIDETFSSLVFESPDEAINSAFAFSKLRAVESILIQKDA